MFGCYILTPYFLKELYASNNHLKSLPTSFCKLEKMTVLDLSDNCLKCLPENIGDLTRLKVLKLNGNKSLHNLPKTICCMQSLVQMDLDCDNFSYPPAAVIRQGTESILKFICDGMKGFIVHFKSSKRQF